MPSLQRPVTELRRDRGRTAKLPLPRRLSGRPSPIPPRVPARRIQIVAAVVGAASLGAEIAAARLLAPWFGASTIIWANTIATVLVALSAGYWVGGRLADRDPTLAGLCRLVLGAAALLALVPFVAGPFLSVSVDALDRVEAGGLRGALRAGARPPGGAGPGRP